MFKNHKLNRLLIIIIFDLLFFTMIDPKTTPSIVVVLGFGLLVASFYLATRLLGDFLSSKFTGLHNSKRIAGLISVGFAIMVGMQSIGQLTIRDLTAIVPLMIVVYFYLSYFKKRA